MGYASNQANLAGVLAVMAAVAGLLGSLSLIRACLLDHEMAVGSVEQMRPAEISFRPLERFQARNHSTPTVRSCAPRTTSWKGYLKRAAEGREQDPRREGEARAA